MPRTAPKLHNPDLDYLHANYSALRACTAPGARTPNALTPWSAKAPTSPGGSHPPLDLTALDLICDLTEDTIGWLRQAGLQHNGSMPAPIAQLDTLLHHSRRRTSTWTKDVESWAENQASKIRHYLDPTPAGQTLTTACPICGTQQSLRIRILKTTTHNEPYLACESGYCTPPDGYCANYLGPTPVWPMAEWEWFATLLQAQENASP